MTYGGTVDVQMSFAYLQRGWNRHPLGGVRRLGGLPGIASRRCFSPFTLGNAPRSPSVYGCRVLWKRSCDGASSTICPAYITAIRSATFATVDTSWEMMISVIRSAFWIARTSSMIFDAVITSRAVVGSSMITSFGLSAKAIAIMARCFIPPLYSRSEEHTSELQSRSDLVCRLLLEKKKKK